MFTQSQVLKWVWVGALTVWVLAEIFLWTQVYEAHTFAQASSRTKWLATISCVGIWLAVLPAVRAVRRPRH